VIFARVFLRNGNLKTGNLILIILAGLSFTIPAAAQTNGMVRVWTAKDGAKITAYLFRYKDGDVTLKSAQQTFKIKEVSLSDADRNYIKTHIDPYYGYNGDNPSERRAFEKSLARDRLRTTSNNEDSEQEEIQSLIKQTKAELEEIFKGALTGNPRQGDVGRFQASGVIINQILGPQSALVTYKYSRDEKILRQVLLQGVPTEGMADDMEWLLPGKFIVDGTHTYKTALGSLRTVLVLKPYVPPSPKE
jgi:hypothetical protein